jgi:hypothetical protein
MKMSVHFAAELGRKRVMGLVATKALEANRTFACLTVRLVDGFRHRRHPYRWEDYQMQNPWQLKLTAGVENASVWSSRN